MAKPRICNPSRPSPNTTMRLAATMASMSPSSALSGMTANTPSRSFSAPFDNWARVSVIVSSSVVPHLNGSAPHDRALALDLPRPAGRAGGRVEQNLGGDRAHFEMGQEDRRQRRVQMLGDLAIVV